MSDRINVEISGALFIEGEILKMDVRLNRRLLGSAADSHREIGDAVGRQAASLQARETGEIQVTSGKIQAKLDVRAVDIRPAEARQTDGRAAGKWSIVGAGVDVVELKLVVGDAEVTFQ